MAEKIQGGHIFGMSAGGLTELGIEHESIEANQKPHLVQLFHSPALCFGNHLSLCNLTVGFHYSQAVTLEIGEALGHGLLLSQDISDRFCILDRDGGFQYSITERSELDNLSALLIQILSRNLQNFFARGEEKLSEQRDSPTSGQSRKPENAFIPFG